MRESDREDVRRPRGCERVERGLESGAGGEDVVYDYIGVCGVERVRGAEGAAHILFALVTRERDLRGRLAGAGENR